MAVNHETGSAGRSEIGKLGASTFIFGVTTVSLLAGFGIALGRVKRKSPTEFNEIAANKLARKALGYGTLLSISGCGLLGLAVRWALGAKNLEEFSQKMKQNLPHKDGEFVNKFDSWKRPRTSNSVDDEEWEEAVSK